MDADHYDIIIIGTGAGGGSLLHALAPTGKRILVLERGGFVPRELSNWDTKAVNLDGRYNTKEVWHDADGRPLHPHTNYFVGGNTKFYGSALFRLRREDFGEIKHWSGVSPAWPIAYEDLGPYYTKAESLYHVHGERAVPAPARQSRAAHPAPGRRLRPAGPPSVSRPPRDHARRGEPADERLHPLLHLRRPSLLALREVRRPSGGGGSGAPSSERHPAHGRVRLEAADERHGSRGDAGRRRAERRAR